MVVLGVDGQIGFLVVIQTVGIEQEIAEAQIVGAGLTFQESAQDVETCALDVIEQGTVLFVAMLAMIFLLSGNNRLITAAIVLAYGCFGGIMGSFPSLSSEIFGLQYAGQNYGIVMSGIVIVTIISPIISNMIISHGLPESVRFITGFCFAVIAMIFSMLLKKEINQSGKEVKSYGTCKNERSAS